MDGFNVDLSGALNLQNQDYISPAGNQQGGKFLGWLGNNYLGLSQAAVNVSCIFNPDSCRQNVNIQPQQQQEEQGIGAIVWIVVAVVAIVILIVALRK
ncbi:hypothetical protein [Phaeodactylibacter xiamenensis]|uniref:hypothetical protein n=1 Tax=Phaeodactylibacter xiamenensis TaxID=1524460 RepID=UPI003CCC2E47